MSLLMLIASSKILLWINAFIQLMLPHYQFLSFFDCVEYHSLLHFSMVCEMSLCTLEFFMISINSAIHLDEKGCSMKKLP